MLLCKGCESQVMILFTLPNGDRLCDYCSAKELVPVKPVRKKRIVNNTRFSILQVHGTVKAFCKAYSLSTTLVGTVLCKRYKKTKPSESQKGVLKILVRNNLDEFLVGEKYMTKKLWKEMRRELCN